MKETIDFAITYEKSFENLTYNCVSSAKDKNIFVHLNLVDISSTQRGFTTDSWYECLKKKMIFAKKIFDSISKDNILCVSDSDILYLDSERVVPHIKKIFKENKIDIVGMCDNFYDFFDQSTKHKLLNCGYFFIQKNPNTLNFFDDLLEYDFRNFKFAEQQIINNIILVEQKNKIKYKLLSPFSYPMGCYINKILDHHEKNQSDENIVLIHTTCTNNKKEKIEQIDKLIDHYKLPKLNWKNPELTKEEIVLYYNHKPL